VEVLVELLEALEAGNGNKEVALSVADEVLDVALLVPRATRQQRWSKR
jgi:hypothetical protein